MSIAHSLHPAAAFSAFGLLVVFSSLRYISLHAALSFFHPARSPIMASSDNSEAGLPHSQSQPPSTDPQPADQQSKKRSKQQLSCAGKFLPFNPSACQSILMGFCVECRRLKLKCDRDIPCSNCVRRGCRELCPDGVKETRRALVALFSLVCLSLLPFLTHCI